MCQFVLVPAFLGRVRNDYGSCVFAWQECEGRPLRCAKLQPVHGGAGCIFATGRPRSAAHAHSPPAEPCGKRRTQAVPQRFPEVTRGSGGHAGRAREFKHAPDVGEM